MLAAFLAIGLIFSLFAWCAFELAARADKAPENFPNENPQSDGLPLSARRPVPGGSSSLIAAGDTLNNEGD